MFRAESTNSLDARPLVNDAEADEAEDATCPYHKGLITVTGAKEGAVFWCPIGRQYWRYRRHTNAGFKSRLRYPRLGLV